MAWTAFAAVAGDPPQGTGERFLPEAAPGWKMSYSYRVPGLEVWEFLPQGQSLDDWRDMITAQAFPAAADIAPRALLASVAERARAVCAETLASPVQEGLAAGYPAAHMGLLCLRDTERRRGDLVLYRAIQAGGTSYVLSRTRRDQAYEPGERDLPERAISAWSAELEGFRVCRNGHDGTRCNPERKP